MLSANQNKQGSGSIFNTTKVKYSSETKNLLKLLMEESHMSMMQRRRLEKFVSSGSPLPADAVPKTLVQQQVPMNLAPKNSSASLRSRNTIEQSGAYQREKYVPGPIVDKEKEKLRFQDRMAYGETVPETARLKRRLLRRAQTEVEENRVDRFDELIEEVKDRKEFLENMETLGLGAKYRPLISGEIALKIKEMENIDRNRTNQFRLRQNSISNL